MLIQIDPAPSATIGGMLSTGCSGSKLTFIQRYPKYTNSLIAHAANAVRYGTAKAEWFLNAVRLLASVHLSLQETYYF